MIIINLLNYNLSNQERQQLEYCFVDKNKDVGRFLVANMESLSNSVKGNIDHKNLEHFHEFLRGYTYIPVTFVLQKIILIITSVV